MTASLATGGSCGVYNVVIHTDRAVLSDEERARLDRLAKPSLLWSIFHITQGTKRRSSRL